MRKHAAAGVLSLATVVCALASAAPGLAATTVECKGSYQINVPSAAPMSDATSTVGALLVPAAAKVVGGTAMVTDRSTGEPPAADALPAGQTWSIVFSGRPDAAHPWPAAGQWWLLVMRVSHPNTQVVSTNPPTWVWTLTYSLPGNACPYGATQVSSSAASTSTTSPAPSARVKPTVTVTEGAGGAITLKLDGLPSRFTIDAPSGHTFSGVQGLDGLTCTDDGAHAMCTASSAPVAIDSVIVELTPKVTGAVSAAAQTSKDATSIELTTGSTQSAESSAAAAKAYASYQEIDVQLTQLISDARSGTLQGTGAVGEKLGPILATQKNTFEHYFPIVFGCPFDELFTVLWSSVETLDDEIVDQTRGAGKPYPWLGYAALFLSYASDDLAHACSTAPEDVRSAVARLQSKTESLKAAADSGKIEGTALVAAMAELRAGIRGLMTSSFPELYGMSYRDLADRQAKIAEDKIEASSRWKVGDRAASVKALQDLVQQKQAIEAALKHAAGA